MNKWAYEITQISLGYEAAGGSGVLIPADDRWEKLSSLLFTDPWLIKDGSRYEM